MEYKFYKKKVYLNFTVLKISTVTMRAKLYTVFQEALRLLYNVSLRLPWEERVSHLSKFFQTLYMLAYIEEERYNTIKGAIVQWEKMVSRVESGDIESLNISREQILDSEVSIGMVQFLVPKRFNH